MPVTHPPRRKSCFECIKAKRRCDQASPCGRCHSKALECSGAWKSSQTTQQQATTELPSSKIAATVQIPFLASDATSLENQDFEMPQSEDLALDGIANLLQETEQVPQVPSVPKERLSFCISQFKTYPPMLVKFNQTPFIHRYLYDNHRPRSIQDLYAVSALYSSKNVANEDMVWRVLDGKLADLLECRAYTKSPIELLAQTQALVLFQIIRLFDSDIRQRANAEQQEVILAKWANELSATVQDARNDSASTWESWIFAESARRTLFVALLFPAVYCTVKHGVCSMEIAKRITNISFCAQKRLWEASSSFHWQVAYRDFDHFGMTAYELDHLFDNASIKDIEEFGVLIMVKYRGLGAVREWISRVGNGNTIESLLLQVEYERRTIGD